MEYVNYDRAWRFVDAHCRMVLGQKYAHQQLLAIVNDMPCEKDHIVSMYIILKIQQTEIKKFTNCQQS